MNVKEPEYLKQYVEGENESETLEGSHHLIVEIIKTLTVLDEQNCIITEFNMNINYKKNPVQKESLTYLGSTDDGSDVTMDTKNIEIIGNIKGIKEKRLYYILEKYANEGWHFKDKFGRETDEILEGFCKCYGKKVISELLDCPIGDLNHYHVNISDVNALMDTFGLYYRIKEIGHQCKVIRTDEKGNEI